MKDPCGSPLLRRRNLRLLPFPVSSEISDLCEISDLLLFLSYFASHDKEIKFGNYFLICVV